VDKLKQYTAENKPVLVDFTADWCPNCKWNEKTALNIESTMQLKEELGFVFLYADWTTKNDEIGGVLEKLGFLSVPLTAIFPAGNPNAPILLDGVYTPTRLHEAMREAAPGGGQFKLGEGQDGQETQVDQAVEETVDLAQLERPDMFLESRYAVLVDAIQDRTQVHPGEEFILAARLIPFENEQFFFHVYGAEPSPDWSYVPSVAQMDPAEGVAWGEFVFPPGEARESQMWLTGQPVIYVSGKLADDAEPGEREFTAQIMFSACTEEMCLAPSQIELSWNVEVLPAGTPASTSALTLAQLMAPVDVDINRYMLPETGDNLGAGLDLDADADQG
jgi:thiol-disulfide isomerase/thioredoxin